MRQIHIAGAGPAGTAAAIAALSEEAAVHIFEKSTSARPKVCGEFLASETCRVLDDLGVWEPFVRLNPGRIRRCVLRFGARTKQWKLAEPAFSLSRFELDQLLLERCLALGATLTRGAPYRLAQMNATDSVILATGRRGRAEGPRRLFGFKTHFEGVIDDSVTLYFTSFGYVGISPIENGVTNVCGIAPLHVLRRFGFEIDELLDTEAPIAGDLRGLRRRMPWLHVGPLVFSASGEPFAGERVYPAGDALGFLDPFTGSGILNALLTGRLAGTAAGRGIPVEDHLRVCRSLLRRPFAVARIFREFLYGPLSRLAPFVPGGLLYRLTRPAVLGAADV